MFCLFGSHTIYMQAASSSRLLLQLLHLMRMLSCRSKKNAGDDVGGDDDDADFRVKLTLTYNMYIKRCMDDTFV